MNDFDDTTFDKFARRFAGIERLIPEPPLRALTPLVRRRSGLGNIARAAVLVGVVVMLAGLIGVAAVGSRPAPVPTVPPDSAPPGVVLDVYLQALRAGDCDTARQLTVPLQFGEWNSRLCSVASQISASRVPASSPAWGGLNKLMVDATLAITDSARGLAGAEVTVRFVLQQQASGAWRIVDVFPETIYPFRLPSPLPT